VEASRRDTAIVLPVHPDHHGADDFDICDDQSIGGCWCPKGIGWAAS
jgi:hypothetical protein